MQATAQRGASVFELMDKYEWVDHLGEGSYALVYKAKCRVSVKFI